MKPITLTNLVIWPMLLAMIMRLNNCGLGYTWTNYTFQYFGLKLTDICSLGWAHLKKEDSQNNFQQLVGLRGEGPPWFSVLEVTDEVIPNIRPALRPTHLETLCCGGWGLNKKVTIRAHFTPSLNRFTSLLGKSACIHSKIEFGLLKHWWKEVNIALTFPFWAKRIRNKAWLQIELHVFPYP